MEGLDEAEMGVKSRLDIVAVVVTGSNHIREGGGVRRKDDGRLSKQ